MIKIKKFTTEGTEHTGKDFSVKENSISLTRAQQMAVFDGMTDADWAREQACQAEWDREIRRRQCLRHAMYAVAQRQMVDKS